MPRRLAVLMMRTAISPRLAIRIFSNMMTDRLPLGFLPRVAIGAQAGGDAQPSIRGGRAGNQAPPPPDVSGVVAPKLGTLLPCRTSRPGTRMHRSEEHTSELQSL